MSLVKEVGKNNGSAALVVAVSAAPAAGNVLIARGGFRASAATTLTSVTDTQGNTWLIHVQNNASGGHSFVASTAQDVGTLTTADTITFTPSGSVGNGISVIVDEFSGVDTSSSRGDQTNTATGSTTSRDAGSVTTLFANELIVAAYAANGQETSFTPDAAYSAFTTGFQQFGTTLFVEGQYRIVSATGTYATPATGGLSISALGAVATFKLAGGGGGTAYTITPADGVTMADSYDRVATFARSMADIAHMADALTRATAYARSMADAITTSDIFSRVSSLSLVIADGISLIESFFKTTARPRPVLSATPITDRTLSAVTDSPTSGTYPGADTYPGSDVYPGKGSQLVASPLTPRILTEEEA
jgi:hypothetical protein